MNETDPASPIHDDADATVRKEFEAANHLLTRREVLKAAAGAAAITPLISLQEVLAQNGAGQSKTAGTEVSAPRFFTPAEFAIVDELTEMIIPSDEHSPGARAAKVVVYLDARLAELNPAISDHAQEQKAWRDGLKLVDRLSQEMHNRLFMQGSIEERDAVLRRMAEQEPRQTRPRSLKEALQEQQKPKSPDDIYREQARKNENPEKDAATARKGEGEFFVFLKERTARAYYTSKVGLLTEMDYKGNCYLREFVGYDRDGHYTEAPPRRTKTTG